MPDSTCHDTCCAKPSGTWKILTVLALAVAVGFVLYGKKQLTPPPAGPAGDTALPRFVEIGSDTCTACKAMMPVLDALRDEYRGRLAVEFVDVWKNPEAATPYAVRIIPTQVFVDASGQALFRHEGFFSKEEILAKWKELGVDLGAPSPSRPESPKP
jgi:thioredoxin 1